ncbi:hypothetical protein OA408_03245, partial [Acidimicrobiaceae bacterium]|nr:hypothetical protein [Acidimicrobiaceae bacterium]
IKILLLIITVSIFVYMFVSDTDTDLIQIDLCNDAIDLNIRENICEGAIGWLGFSTGSNIDMFYFWQDSNQRFYIWYVPLLILSTIPLVSKIWIKDNYLFLILSLLSFIPLFYLAYDWGRYIWILIFLLSILYLLENTQEIKFTKLSNKYFLILYSSLWYLPIARGLRLDNFYQNMTFRLLIVFLLIFFFITNNYIKNEKY